MPTVHFIGGILGGTSQELEWKDIPEEKHVLLPPEPMQVYPVDHAPPLGRGYRFEWQRYKLLILANGPSTVQVERYLDAGLTRVMVPVPNPQYVERYEYHLIN